MSKHETTYAHEVLLVDDDPELLHGLCRVLHKQPYRLLTARNAQEALRVVKSRPIGVVVSDEQMPGLPGTEMLAWVARECPEVVRILLTGHATPETTVKAVNEGKVFRFFTKPANPVELALAIREALDHRAGATATEELAATKA